MITSELSFAIAAFVISLLSLLVLLVKVKEIEMRQRHIMENVLMLRKFVINIRKYLS